MPTDARLERMSMYSELLAATLAAVADEPEPADEDALLRRMAAARGAARPRAGSSGSVAGDASSSIARELDYDMALIALCRRHGITCGAAGFTRPGPERARLERALSARGVPVTSEHAPPPPAPGRGAAQPGSAAPASAR